MKRREGETIKAFLERAGACEERRKVYSRFQTITAAIRVANRDDLDWAFPRIIPVRSRNKALRMAGVEECSCGYYHSYFASSDQLRQALLVYLGEAR